MAPRPRPTARKLRHWLGPPLSRRVRRAPSGQSRLQFRVDAFEVPDRQQAAGRHGSSAPPCQARSAHHGRVEPVSTGQRGREAGPERRPVDPERWLGNHGHGRSRCRLQGGGRQNACRTGHRQRRNQVGLLRRSERRQRRGAGAIAVERGPGFARRRGSGVGLGPTSGVGGIMRTVAEAQWPARFRGPARSPPRASRMQSGD